ncbi:hypothetical protein, partial [Methanosphaera sp. WGK6]|uniref:hypothetical protein n=1 Tax=Methanosphaera sp. WGK6 TaxID=1561964 RepID=UPI00086ED213
MTNKKLFSIIIFNKNTHNDLTHTLKSIFNQSLNFKENIEVFIIEKILDYTSIIDYKEKYPENIFAYNYTEFFNNYEELIKGKYVNFIENGAIFEENLFENINETFTQNHINCIRIPVSNNDNYFKTYLNYIYTTKQTINVVDDYMYIGLIPDNFFIKKDFLFRLVNSSKFINNNPLTIITTILLNSRRYMILNNTSMSICPGKQLFYTDINQFKKIIDTLIETYETNNQIPRYLQIIILIHISKSIQHDNN